MFGVGRLNSCAAARRAGAGGGVSRAAGCCAGLWLWALSPCTAPQSPSGAPHMHPLIPCSPPAPSSSPLHPVSPCTHPCSHLHPPPDATAPPGTPDSAGTPPCSSHPPSHQPPQLSFPAPIASCSPHVPLPSTMHTSTNPKSTPSPRPDPLAQAPDIPLHPKCFIASSSWCPQTGDMAVPSPTGLCRVVSLLPLKPDVSPTCGSPAMPGWQ